MPHACTASAVDLTSWSWQC